MDIALHATEVSSMYPLINSCLLDGEEAEAIIMAQTATVQSAAVPLKKRNTLLQLNPSPFHSTL